MYIYIKNFMTQLQMSSKLICQKFSLFLFFFIFKKNFRTGTEKILLYIKNMLFLKRPLLPLCQDKKTKEESKYITKNHFSLKLIRYNDF